MFMANLDQYLVFVDNLDNSEGYLSFVQSRSSRRLGQLSFVHFSLIDELNGINQFGQRFTPTSH